MSLPAPKAVPVTPFDPSVSADSIVINTHPHLYAQPVSNASSLETIHPSANNLSNRTTPIPKSQTHHTSKSIQSAKSLSINTISQVKIPTKPDKNDDGKTNQMHEQFRV
jgi:hypothetical protein